MVKRYVAAALSLSLAALVTACSSSASQEEQMEYLHKMAQRGAELHAVKKGSQGHGTPGDREECYGAYEHLYDGPNGHDAPHVGTDVERVALLKEGEELFIESCVNGTPSPVPARGGSASPSA